jgi:hypothetical protein
VCATCAEPGKEAYRQVGKPERSLVGFLERVDVARAYTRAPPRTQKQQKCSHIVPFDAQRCGLDAQSDAPSRASCSCHGSARLRRGGRVQGTTADHQT